jgi:Flp pilus assembly protein protease CpaA
LLLGAAFLGVPFVMGGVAGGDVKLLAAIGSLMGPSAVLHIFIYAALSGAVLAVCLIIRSGRRTVRLKNVWQDIQAVVLTGRRSAPAWPSMGFRYSIPIAIAFGGYLLFDGPR